MPGQPNARALERLRKEVEALLSERRGTATSAGAGTLTDVLGDGYAEMLNLDYECLKLEREIRRSASLATSGDASRLRALCQRLSELTTERDRFKRTLNALRASKMRMSAH